MDARISRATGKVAILCTAAAIAVAGTVSVASASTRHAAPTAKYNAAAAKLVPSSIKNQSAHGGLIEAFDATYAPDEFLASNNSTIVGFDADLGKAIATTLGLKFAPRNVTFDNIIPKLQAGSIQIGNSSFTDNTTREKQVNFVDYFVAGEAFYVKASSSLKLNSLAALCGHSVAVEAGTVEQTDATNEIAKCTGGKTITVVTYPTQTLANAAVSSGHQEAGFADSQVSGYIVTKSKGLFKLAGSAINVAPYGFALSKKTTFDKAVVAAVNILIKNGVYGAILKHWGVQAGAIKTAVINHPNLT